jgi:adenylate cyclase
MSEPHPRPPPATPVQKLPARVRDVISREQDASEILIGWVQLGVVLTFAALYYLSPKQPGANPMISPEPWVLAAYVLFTLVRLNLAYRRRLPNWLLYVSVVMDMALLLVLIWSFHLKYDQPASFYLKVPTLLYVFIFIALRALRFEVRYVLIAGGVAALGWLLMVLYVVSVDPSDPMITRDYVEYMTSNSVLLGAEFDKVISILMVTAILAVAIARARRLLIASVVESSTARELSKFVPDEVARQAKAGEEHLQAGQGEVRPSARP